jgi:hypothetical protein
VQLPAASAALPAGLPGRLGAGGELTRLTASTPGREPFSGADAGAFIVSTAADTQGSRQRWGEVSRHPDAARRCFLCSQPPAICCPVLSYPPMPAWASAAAAQATPSPPAQPSHPPTCAICIHDVRQLCGQAAGVAVDLLQQATAHAKCNRLQRGWEAKVRSKAVQCTPPYTVGTAAAAVQCQKYCRLCSLPARCTPRPSPPAGWPQCCGSRCHLPAEERGTEE